MEAPKIHKIDNIRFHKSTSYTLDNEIPVTAFHTNDLKVLKIDFAFPAGRLFQEKPYQASLTNAIIREGSIQHPNSTEIEEQLDYYGIFVQQRLESYLSVYSFFIPLMHLDKALPLAEEILFSPAMEIESLEFLKERTRSALLKNLEKPAFLARAHANQQFWGKEHPLGKFPCAGFLNRIGIEDLKTYYQERYRNKKFNIYLSGNYPERLINDLNTTFGQHQVSEVDSAVMSLEPNKEISIIEKKIDKQVQTAIHWIAPCITPHDNGYFDFKIMNTIFGDYFGSRLMTNIREEKAYTYGIYSSIRPSKVATTLNIQTEVGKEYFEDTIKQINYEIDCMRDDLVDDEEMELLRNYMSGELLGVFDGVFHHGSVQRYLNEMSLDFNYYSNYIERIQSITPEEIRDAARKHLHTDNFHKIYIG